jgi:hypothetical protein
MAGPNLRQRGGRVAGRELRRQAAAIGPMNKSEPTDSDAPVSGLLRQGTAFIAISRRLPT